MLTNKQNWSNLSSVFVELVQSHKQLSNQVKDLQKQLKKKINKNQFIIGMQSKLSISDASNIAQNIFSKKPKDNQKIQKIINQQCNQIISVMLKQEISTLKKNLIQQQENIMNRKFQQYKNNNLFTQNQIKIHFQQLQEIIYQKSDRSEITKLFKLHQLIVVEIQQQKQRLSIIQINSDKSLSKMDQRLQGFKQILTQIQRQYSERIQKITQYVQDSIQYLQQSTNRTLDLVEMRQKQIQQILTSNNSEKSIDNIYSIMQESIQDCRQMILNLHKNQDSHQLTIRQTQTRINILQMKQNQIHQTFKQTQKINQKLSKQSYQILKLSQTLSMHQQNIKKQIQDYNNKLDKQKKKLKDIQKNNQFLMEKYKILYLQAVKQDDLDQKIKGNFDILIKNIQEIDTKYIQKISQIENKIQKYKKVHQQNYSNIQQHILIINSQLNNKIKINQLKQIIKNLVSADQVRQIAIQLQKKFSQYIQSIQKQQKGINQALCSENVVGRWLWTEGGLKGGNLVLWNHQIINTLPQNFKWIKQQPVIIIASSGLYKVEIAFYSRNKKPTIQILVNGQTIISAINNNSYVLHHSSGKLKSISGQVTGISFIDFFLLPENSRIAISYIGEAGEGFIGFQRL